MREHKQVCLDTCHNLKFLEKKIQKHYLPQRELFLRITPRAHHRGSLNARHVAHKPTPYSPFHSDPLHSLPLSLSDSLHTISPFHSDPLHSLSLNCTPRLSLSSFPPHTKPLLSSTFPFSFTDLATAHLLLIALPTLQISS